MPLKSISRLELAEHTTCSSLWIIFKGNVYDVTEFIFDHPGGQDILLQYAGQEMDIVFMDKEIHSHSNIALKILSQYQIGVFKDDSCDNTDDERTTNSILDKKTVEFIDITKPMVLQVFYSNWTREFYLDEGWCISSNAHALVHKSRHSKTSAPLFGSALLEPFTKTPWYIVPLVWLPIVCYFWMKSVSILHDPYITLQCFVTGVFVWTLIEYTLHRFLFHIEDHLPRHRYAYTFHFLTHGVHHLLPMDRMRLVMPPVLLALLSFPIVQTFHLLFSSGIAGGLTSGGYFGYICYDVMHFYLHHSRPGLAYAREMKSYHLDHHYKNPKIGFGISSKIWDYAFDTVG